MMGVQLMEYARLQSISKFVAIGTICSYPKFTPVPFKEEDLWNGYPEETNAPYGLAKKMLLVQAQAYRQQYGFNAIFFCRSICMVPGITSIRRAQHAIPAIIRKCVEAVDSGAKEVVLWERVKRRESFSMRTMQRREFFLAAERYNGDEPVNYRGGHGDQHCRPATMIAKFTGFTGSIVWDSSKPDGQPRRCLDVSKAEREFGFRARIPFEKGLKETVEWYCTSRYEIDRSTAL
jgi:GDP-L-fucose synthase